MIITIAPHRLTFSGGGTDFPEYYHEKASIITGLAIKRYATVVLANPDVEVDCKFIVSYSENERAETVESIKHPIVKAALQYFDLDVPLHITSIADVPASTGLGTSSAFTVALVAALYRFKKQVVTKEEIAKTAIHVEREVGGLAGGHQDQWWAALGGFGSLEFNKSGVQFFPIKDQRLVNFVENNLYLISLNEQRHSAKASATLIHKLEERQLTNLDNMRNIAYSMHDRINQNLSIEQKIKLISNTLQNTWKNKKKQIQTSDKLLELEKLTESHSIPMKLCGGGYSGFVSIIANQAQIETFKQQGYNPLPISIDKNGVQVIHG